ncbi:MAG TPA: hypothetical protein VMR28_03590 [Candidatus Saccharimonadales bacterium]|nr:hypothetical protein [Candidatus Saccharimonadales bacterium]
MPQEYSTPNKQQKHPKTYFQQYLYNAGEPQDDISQDSPGLREAELLEDSYFMRRKFRHIARRLRERDL